ncbi:(2Fe-2S)-binding protein [Streptomyces sp. CJ_13]|uniref:(2Fe-2S)-binding protein n=1 Tax=Streptomyces sp. CJ_13 TaxID=2724943 RepID=UPI002029F2BE|nr:(2Fe-2S)-binding protein [Streptomyces sp. CJ_13]
MSENEIGNMSGGSGPGQAEPVWGWEPVPHGGEYDSDATAFVKLPEDMLNALGTGEPLAAPGHGYVPPPMIVPLGSATTDPSATGTWALPVQWPEAGAEPAPAPAPVGGPIPASIPLPPSVAQAFAASQGGEAEHDPGATAEWRFPQGEREREQGQGQQEQPQPDGQGHGQGHGTGQWAMPASVTGTGALDADWSQAPATLPGGAAAPWATHSGHPGNSGHFDHSGNFEHAGHPGQSGQSGQPGQSGYAGYSGYEDARGYAPEQPGTSEGDLSLTSGVLPGLAEAARGFGGHGAGAPSRGPRVLGGPGVGTLPEGEPAHPAPHDIEAAHGAAAAPAAAQRPHPGAEAGHAGDGYGYVEAGHAHDAEQRQRQQQPEPERGPEPEPAEAAAYEPEGFEPTGFEAAGAGPDGAEADGFEPDGAEADGVEPHGVEADGFGTGAAAPGGPAGAAEHDEHGFTRAGLALAEEGESPVPAEGVTDTAGATPDADSAGGFPARDTTYDEEDVAVPAAHHEHPSASYVLRVNGADRPVTGAWIGESLLYVLRERLGLAGAKDGCSQGECGACAVQVDGRLVASCLVPAATAAGSEVRTVEGLATDGELSDVQQALCRSGAVQCGFCVPGMAMTIHDLLEGNHAPSELETRQALCGNLCRCSGYTGVIDAVREVVAEREATAAEAEAAASGAEPRIPHQAPPGEGGIHGDHGHQGNHGHQGDHGPHGDQGDHGTHGTHGPHHNGGMA